MQDCRRILSSTNCERAAGRWRLSRSSHGLIDLGAMAHGPRNPCPMHNPCPRLAFRQPRPDSRDWWAACSCQFTLSPVPAACWPRQLHQEHPRMLVLCGRYECDYKPQHLSPLFTSCTSSGCTPTPLPLREPATTQPRLHAHGTHLAAHTRTLAAYQAALSNTTLEMPEMHISCHVSTRTFCSFMGAELWTSDPWPASSWRQLELEYVSTRTLHWAAKADGGP